MGFLLSHIIGRSSAFVDSLINCLTVNFGHFVSLLMEKLFTAVIAGHRIRPSLAGAGGYSTSVRVQTEAQMLRLLGRLLIGI